MVFQVKYILETIYVSRRITQKRLASFGENWFMPPKLVAFIESLLMPRFISCLPMYLALSILKYRLRLFEPVALSAAPDIWMVKFCSFAIFAISSRLTNCDLSTNFAVFNLK